MICPKCSKYAFFIQKNAPSKKVLIFMNFVNAFLNSICFHEFITKVLLDGYSFDLFNTKFAIVFKKIVKNGSFL